MAGGEIMAGEASISKMKQWRRIEERKYRINRRKTKIEKRNQRKYGENEISANQRQSSKA